MSGALRAIARTVRWHDLRHTCASSLVAGGWGPRWSLEEPCIARSLRLARCVRFGWSARHVKAVPPWLSNIYLHYAQDRWVQQRRICSCSSNPVDGVRRTTPWTRAWQPANVVGAVL
jgi:hypothetical protein